MKMKRDKIMTFMDSMPTGIIVLDWRKLSDAYHLPVPPTITVWIRAPKDAAVFHQGEGREAAERVKDIPSAISSFPYTVMGLRSLKDRYILLSASMDNFFIGSTIFLEYSAETPNATKIISKINIGVEA